MLGNACWSRNERGFYSLRALQYTKCVVKCSEQEEAVYLSCTLAWYTQFLRTE